MAFTLRKLAPVPLLLLFASALVGQGLLSGKVTDKDGKPLAGVTVVIKQIRPPQRPSQS